MGKRDDKTTTRAPSPSSTTEKKPRSHSQSDKGGGKGSKSKAKEATSARTPNTAESTGNADRGGGDDIDSQRQRLTRFYQYYAPSKMSDVEKNVTKYSDPERGGFARMWEQLEIKYGPEASVTEAAQFANSAGPSGTDQPGARQPHPAAAVDRNRSSGPSAPPRNDWGAVGSDRRYSEEERAVWKDKLRKFYASLAMPKMDGELDSILDMYSPPDGYERMWQQLLKKYPRANPEPEPDTGLFKRFIPEAGASKAASPVGGSPRAGGGAPLRWDSSPRARSAPGGGALDYSAQGEYDDGGAGGDGALLNPELMRHDDELTALSTVDTDRVPYSPLGHNATAVVLHALLRLQGATIMLYERADDEKQHRFRQAIEAEVGINLGIDKRQVKVVKINPGISAELEIELTHDQVKRAVGEQLVTKVLMGTFTVKCIRESYRRDLDGNPIQIHAEGAAIFGGACVPQFQDGGVAPPGTASGAFSVSSHSRMMGELTSAEMALAAPPASNAAAVTGMWAAEAPGLWPPVRSDAVGPGGLASRTRDSSPSHSGFMPGGSFATPPMQSAPSPVRSWISHPATIPSGSSLSITNGRLIPPPEPMRPVTSRIHPSGAPAAAAASTVPTRVRLENAQRQDLVSPGAFLRTIWGEDRPVVPEAPPIVPRSRLGPSDFHAQMQRETAKPMHLNLAPSTDNAPLPTRTAPPTVTQFQPGANVEPRFLAHRDDTLPSALRGLDDTINNLHVKELIDAISEPRDYYRTGGSTMVRDAPRLAPQDPPMPRAMEPDAAHRAARGNLPDHFFQMRQATPREAMGGAGGLRDRPSPPPPWAVGASPFVVEPGVSYPTPPPPPQPHPAHGSSHHMPTPPASFSRYPSDPGYYRPGEYTTSPSRNGAVPASRGGGQRQSAVGGKDDYLFEILEALEASPREY